MKKNTLALASLITGIACFINLLGIEKAVIAIILGVFALREAERNPDIGGKAKSYAGILFGILYLITVIIILLIKGPDVLSYIRGLAPK